MLLNLAPQNGSISANLTTDLTELFILAAQSKLEIQSPNLWMTFSSV